MNCLRPAHALCGACGLFPAANLSFFLLKRKLFRVLSFSEGNFPEIFPFQKETSPEKWPQRLLCEKFLAILPVFSRKVGEGVGERGRQSRFCFLGSSMHGPAASSRGSPSGAEVLILWLLLRGVGEKVCELRAAFGRNSYICNGIIKSVCRHASHGRPDVLAACLKGSGQLM